VLDLLEKYEPKRIRMLSSKPPFGIKIIASVNGLAAILHLLFWIFAFIKLPSIHSENTIADKINLATTYGFGIADLIWSVPLLFIGCIALWRIKLIGWLAAHMANILYWYSFTVIISRDLSSDSISPGAILFFPFAVFSFWAGYFLWKFRTAYLK